MDEVVKPVQNYSPSEVPVIDHAYARDTDLTIRVPVNGEFVYESAAARIAQGEATSAQIRQGHIERAVSILRTRTGAELPAHIQKQYNERAAWLASKVEAETPGTDAHSEWSRVLTRHEGLLRGEELHLNGGPEISQGLMERQAATLRKPIDLRNTAVPDMTAGFTPTFTLS